MELKYDFVCPHRSPRECLRSEDHPTAKVVCAIPSRFIPFSTRTLRTVRWFVRREEPVRCVHRTDYKGVGRDGGAQRLHKKPSTRWQPPYGVVMASSREEEANPVQDIHVLVPHIHHSYIQGKFELRRKYWQQPSGNQNLKWQAAGMKMYIQ